MVFFIFVVSWLNLWIDVVYMLVLMFGKIFSILCLFVYWLREMLDKFFVIRVKVCVLLLVCGIMLVMVIGLFWKCIVCDIIMFLFIYS